MALTVVVKLLGRNLAYTTFHNRIFSLWKPTHSFQLMDVENDHFLVRFQNSGITRRFSLKVHGLCSSNISQVSRGLLSSVPSNRSLALSWHGSVYLGYRGRYGHVRDLFPSKGLELGRDGYKEIATVEVQPEKDKIVEALETYGPWMIVGR
ncbi:hypothetical protein Gorai_013457 [Gossypium raimondii]|uniref:DUF4283 domain-containing protein n=1 Tax=Gossypium raimondii TaxID=29730 RepID=A0A7J8Q5S6_GOSRA|nr:hypothetical protein [Gossypium raimondii]